MGKIRHTIKCPATSEIQVVGDLDGYPGWKVISTERGKAADELDHADQLDERAGTWSRCPERHARRIAHGEARDPDKLLERIADLEERVLSLEKKMETSYEYR